MLHVDTKLSANPADSVVVAEGILEQREAIWYPVFYAIVAKEKWSSYEVW